MLINKGIYYPADMKRLYKEYKCWQLLNNSLNQHRCNRLFTATLSM